MRLCYLPEVIKGRDSARHLTRRYIVGLRFPAREVHELFPSGNTSSVWHLRSRALRRQALLASIRLMAPCMQGSIDGLYVTSPGFDVEERRERAVSSSLRVAYGSRHSRAGTSLSRTGREKERLLVPSFRGNPTIKAPGCSGGQRVLLSD